MAESNASNQYQFSKKHIFLVVGNIILGVVLWFGLCSDYVLENVWINITFPVFVGIVGLITKQYKRGKLSNQQKRRQILSSLPAILGGIPYILLFFCSFIPPFILATSFWIGEQASATQIQSIESPDGNQVAEVLFRPVGPYSGGNGRIEIYLKYNGVPFIKRYIYYVRVTRADEDTTSYIEWLDNESLYIPEKNETIEVDNIVEWQLPPFIKLPIAAYYLFRNG